MGRKRKAQCAKCKQQTQQTKFVSGHGEVCVKCKISLCAQGRNDSNVDKGSLPASNPRSGSKRPRDSTEENRTPTHAEVVSSGGGNRHANGRIDENKQVITPFLSIFFGGTVAHVFLTFVRLC